MSSRRICSLAAVLLALALPATSQAQFGQLINKARAIRSKVDSAKSTVDTGKTVIVAAKAAVADATSGLPTDSAGDSASAGKQSKGDGHGSAAAGGAAAGTAATGGPSATRHSASKTPATAKAPVKAAPAAPAAATPATPATRPAAPATSRGTRGGAPPPVTEPLFAQFMRGRAAQSAHLKAKPGDDAGAMDEAVAASGLSKQDYASVNSRATMYGTFASKSKEGQLGGVLDAGDLAVFNAHKSEIVRLVQP
jgi:hypothetical protein